MTVYEVPHFSEGFNPYGVQDKKVGKIILNLLNLTMLNLNVA